CHATEHEEGARKSACHRGDDRHHLDFEGNGHQSPPVTGSSPSGSVCLLWRRTLLAAARPPSVSVHPPAGSCSARPRAASCCSAVPTAPRVGPSASMERASCPCS